MKNLFICLAAVFAFGCAAVGTHLVTGTVHPAVFPESVKLYLAMPTNAEVIGIVTATYARYGKQEDVDKRVAEIKRQAGMLGANSVLLATENNAAAQQPARIIPTGTSFIYLPATDTSAAKLSGTAIYVP